MYKLYEYGIYYIMHMNINYVSGSRSGFSKYNILPSKDEPSKKIDLVENLKKINNDEPTMTVDYNIGKETLRKIDITLTESSDRSESTSSEIHTENLNSDYDLNGIYYSITIPYNKNKI